jgi:uroporphyrinogen decarboxylase
MTCRERVIETINHRKTDRVPSDYGAHAAVSDALIQKLGLSSHEELLQSLEIDMRRISAPYGLPTVGPDDDGYSTTMWGLRYQGESATFKAESVIYPFTEDSTIDDVRAHDWPDPTKLDFSHVKAECEQYKGEYALYGAPWSPFFHEIGWLVGQTNFYMWMTSRPDLVDAIIGHIVDFEIEATRMFLDAAEGSIDITYFGNDFGTQRGLFVGPDMWERFLRAPLKRYFDISKEYGCHVMKHSCGSVREIVPWMIEDGLDILDPVQTVATGMSYPELVRDFGDKIVFHGAVDTQTTLPFGSQKDVRSVVRGFVGESKQKNCYILCGSQELIEDVPLDNVLAMYEPSLRY